jgi:hypothetical protein
MKSVPVPPRLKITDLFLFLGIGEKVQNCVIESLGVRCCVGSRKNGRRSQGKPNLYHGRRVGDMKKIGRLTWVATYATEGMVTRVIP